MAQIRFFWRRSARVKDHRKKALRSIWPVYNKVGAAMKRFLIILLVLFLVAAAGLGFFLATFDVDSARPAVTQKMEEVLGRPVNLERIALRWKDGITVELRGWEIPPALRFDSVWVSLWPLLKRQVAAWGEMGEGTFHLGGTVRRWKPRLEGGFHLEAEKIHLPNVNLLREAFDRMTVIPGLTESLLARLPPEFAQKLTEKDTLFQSMDFRFTLEDEVILFQNFRVTTDSFELAASGRYGLEGSLAFPAQIFIQPDLSAALIQSVEELRLFTDDQRRIVLPVRVEGTVQKPSVSPDLQAVAEKLFSAKAQDLVGELLNKAFKKEEQPPGE